MKRPMQTDDIVRTFQEDGVVVVPDFLDTAELAVLENRLERYIREVVPGLDTGEVFYEDNSDTAIKSLFKMQTHAPEFNELANHKELLHLIGLIFPEGEIECELQKIGCRVGQVETELSALEDQVIDEGEVRSALERFDPIWRELLPDERVRVIRLLVEQITFDPTEGEVELTLRPAGIKALGKGAQELA